MTERHGIIHNSSSKVTGARNYTGAQWERDTTCPRDQSHPARQGEFMRALTSGARCLCSCAHWKPRTTIFLERSAPFLAAANRLFHVDWELAAWNKNCRLSKTDSLLTPWKYGTDEIAHVGITNLQAARFLKRNITLERTRAKTISGRYPTLDVYLTTPLPIGRLYTLVSARIRCVWRVPEQCACDSKATGNLERQADGALTWKNQWHVSPMMGNPMEPLGIGSLQLLSRVAVHLSCQSCWDTARRSAMDTKHAASVASAETRSKLSKSMAVKIRDLSQIFIWSDEHYSG